MAKKDGSPGRIKQITETYKLTKRADPRIGWILAGTFLAVFIVGLILGYLLNAMTFLAPLGFALGLLAVTIVFGRRAERSAYSQIEGQPGAAAAVLKSLRQGWFVSPAIAVNKSQDCVHRVVGRPGVILVSEGPSTRVGGLLANERKKVSRVSPDVNIIEIQCGDEPGQIPLRKLNTKVRKQKRTMKPSQVNELRKRLEALNSQPLSMPKGPVPKSMRAARIPRG